ncbi:MULTISPECIES: hypothetical protein [Halolamina]|uniref:hypothetical protein n=1 Tax=Halolamina TaxID=1075397 RepID=UPI0011606F39|nr:MULTISPECIES: hypothetical protein [Halolamina]NHX35330.1 hypothetical protein [Halolamina sp. R1-12]
MSLSDPRVRVGSRDCEPRCGGKRELSPSTVRYGTGDDDRVWLDWGVDRWSTGIPVAATETPSSTEQ